MIKIITEQRDKTTNEVLEWLLKGNIAFKRLNTNEATPLSIHFPGKRNLKSINDEHKPIVWMRRGKLQLLPKRLRDSVYAKHLLKETFPVLAFIEQQWKQEKLLLGSYIEESLNNKILNLRIAKDVGVLIPETLVTNKKEDRLIQISSAY